MVFGIDIANFITAVMGIVGIVLTLEKVYNWIKNKFNYAHKKVNEADDFKNTLTLQVEEVKKLQAQNEVILEGIKHILRNKLKHDCLRYISREYITQEELEEFEDTYMIYKSIGGNGAGKKYHELVLDLPIGKHEDTEDNKEKK